MKREILEKTSHNESRNAYEPFVFFKKMESGWYRFKDWAVTNKSIFYKNGIEQKYTPLWEKSLDGKTGIIDRKKGYHKQKEYWAKQITIFTQNALYDMMCQDMLDHDRVEIEPGVYLMVRELKTKSYMKDGRYIKPVVNISSDKIRDIKYTFRVKFLGKFRRQYNKRVFTNKEIY